MRIWNIAVLMQLHQTLCNSMDCSPPGFSVPGIFQARIPEWVAISYSRGTFPTQGLNLSVLHWQVDSLPPRHLGSSYGTWIVQNWVLKASDQSLNNPEQQILMLLDALFESLLLKWGRYFLLFFLFWAVLHNLWDLSSLIREWTQAATVKAWNPNH